MLKCLTAIILAACIPSLQADDGKSRYLIGNSLTWDTVPSKLDGDVQWHVDCGISLPYIYDNPEKPCVKASTVWPKALIGKQYDFVSVQSHYGATLEQDASTISKWMKLQPKAVFIVHTGWAREATRAEEFAKKKPGEKMEHSVAYIEALVARLKEDNPGREIRRTRAMDLLDKVARDATAGQAPFKEVKEIYRDAIHMNVVTGRYLMHNAMRHAMGQPRSAKGFEKLDPMLKKYFDQLLDSLDEK
jgi:hypothetical protein